jgi:hypothetical protein
MSVFYIAIDRLFKDRKGNMKSVPKCGRLRSRAVSEVGRVDEIFRSANIIVIRC